MRTSAKQQARNRAVRSQVRMAIRQFRAAATEEKATLLPTTTSAIDNAVRKGVIKNATADRIKSRLAKVTRPDNKLFDPEGLDMVVRYSRGIPRVINILCDNALIAGFGFQEKTVSLDTVRKVIENFNGAGQRRPPALAATGVEQRDEIDQSKRSS